MKVSKDIQNKMHRIAKLGSKMKELSREVDEYFDSKGFNVDDLRCGNGKSLEELEYGNDVTDEFCKYAETDFMDDSIWDVRRT